MSSSTLRRIRKALLKGQKPFGYRIEIVNGKEEKMSEKSELEISKDMGRRRRSPKPYRPLGLVASADVITKLREVIEVVDAEARTCRYIDDWSDEKVAVEVIPTYTGNAFQAIQYRRQELFGDLVAPEKVEPMSRLQLEQRVTELGQLLQTFGQLLHQQDIRLRGLEETAEQLLEQATRTPRNPVPGV